MLVKELDLVTWLEVSGFNYTTMVRRNGLVVFEYEETPEFMAVVSDWNLRPTPEQELAQLLLRTRGEIYARVKKFDQIF